MEPYKINIILPCYKVAQYIERCINSILTQDFPNYEVIIINDGSPDNLLQICKQWEGLSNFTILSFPNQGLSQARNEGLAVAQGEYVYFLDPDDFIEPQLLSTCYQVLSDTHADAIKFGFKSTEIESGISWNTVSKENKGYYSNKDIITEYMPKFIGFSLFDIKQENFKTLWERKEFAGVCMFMYRREILIRNKIYFPKGVSLVEDKIFNVHFFCYARHIEIINKVLYNYQIRTNGLMTGSLRNPRGLIRNKIDGSVEREKLRKLYQKEHGIDIFNTYHGSLILSGMELCVKLSSIKYSDGIKGLHQYLSLPMVQYAFKNLDYQGLSFKLKIASFCITHHLTGLLFTGTWLLTKMGLKIK